MTVHSGSGETYVWPISSGKAGHATPRGVFRPRAMYVMVHSAKYDNAPMPHSIFFYGQYAIHGTNAVGNLGRPASHGCVRLSPAHAATLFAMVQRQGAEIRIVGSPFSDVARSDQRIRIGARVRAAPPHADAQAMGARSARSSEAAAAEHCGRINDASSAPKFVRRGVAFSFRLGYQATLESNRRTAV